MELAVRYRHDAGQPTLARAFFPGEPVIHVNIRTLDHIVEKVAQKRFYARYNLLVRMSEEPTGVDDAIAAVVAEDRAQGYRWALSRSRRDANATRRFEVRHTPAAPSMDAADVWVTFDDGDVYTLWAATPAAIRRVAGEGAPFFYCPNLLVVREVRWDLLRDAVAALGLDIALHGLRDSAA